MAQALHPAGYRTGRLQGAERVVQRHVTSQQNPQAGQQILGVEAADQTGVQLAVAPRGRYRHGQPFGAQPQRLAANLADAQAITESVYVASGQVVVQAAAQSVLQVEHRPFQVGPVE